MTPEEQRISIAEACGWTQIENYNTMSPSGIWVGYPPNQPIVGNKESIPDYCNDLNAMHEAEKILILEERNNYYWNLGTVTDGLAKPSDQRIKFITATSSQRAEAFLKTIGKWKDSSQT